MQNGPARFTPPPAQECVLKDVSGICPYCHQRTKGTWKVRVEISPLWPHRITCPQCHQVWDSVSHFNREAKRITLAVMRENPDRIEQLNKTPEQSGWDTFMADNIEAHKDRQNWETRKVKGRDWDPYDGLMTGFQKRIWTQMGGGSGADAEEAGTDDQASDDDERGVEQGDASDSGQLRRSAGDKASPHRQDD